jgi:hypothetical protein
MGAVRHNARMRQLCLSKQTPLPLRLRASSVPTTDSCTAKKVAKTYGVADPRGAVVGIEALYRAPSIKTDDLHPVRALSCWILADQRQSAARLVDRIN